MTAAEQTLIDADERPAPSRGLAILAFVWITAIVVVSVVWHPELASPYGNYFTLCGFKNITGLPCPGCGLTHSFCALAKGDVSNSLAFNFMGPVLFALLVVVWVRALAVMLRRYRFVESVDRAFDRLRVVKRMTVAFVIFGVVRIVYVLLFHADTIRGNPLPRFVVKLFG
jgi:hypothetical protein